ncbi:MAG: CRISPR-associated endonuclease Cas2 [bacterium]
MSKDIHHIIASYDISNEKRLQRIAKLMKNYGTRVLKSVFECTLSDSYYMAMKYQAESIIDPLEDSIRFYFLCNKCVKNIEKIGKGMKHIKDEDTLIV